MLSQEQYAKIRMLAKQNPQVYQIVKLKDGHNIEYYISYKDFLNSLTGMTEPQPNFLNDYVWVDIPYHRLSTRVPQPARPAGTTVDYRTFSLSYASVMILCNKIFKDYKLEIKNLWTQS